MVEASGETRFSLLPDPIPDRKLTDQQCAKIINKPVSDSELWNGDVPNWRLLKDYLAREGPMTKEQIIKFLMKTLQLLQTESNLVQIEEPICVVGDIHGQYADLLNMISKAGEPGSLNYLFLGDYVDRGIFGIEVCILLFAIKQNFPRNVVMLRGNHESRNMTETFTFRDEVL